MALLVCPSCGAGADSSTKNCPRCGEPFLTGTVAHEDHLSGVALGPYRIVAPLGEGRLGRVYIADDTRGGGRVALKLMHPELQDQTRMVRRFLAEAVTLSRSRHDNVAEVFDLVDTPGERYYVMELLWGDTLRQRISVQQPTLKKAMQVTADLAAGLASVHAAGFVHRELAPERVFLVRQGGGRETVKLGHFGPQKASTAKIPLPDECLSYASPELVMGTEFDGRADLYALGAILHELVLGSTPELARDGDASAFDPKRLGGKGPSQLADLLRRMLATDPGARPASAQAVVDELREIIDALANYLKMPTDATGGVSAPALKKTLAAEDTVDLAERSLDWAKSTDLPIVMPEGWTSSRVKLPCVQRKLLAIGGTALIDYLQQLIDHQTIDHGYVLARFANAERYLFFHRGKTHCAGAIEEGRFISRSVEEFFDDIVSAVHKEYCATDLPLLLCAALPFRKAPSAEIWTAGERPEAVLRTVRDAHRDVVIAVRRDDALSFIFCREGEPVALYASGGEPFDRGDSVSERLFEYLRTYGSEAAISLYSDMKLPPGPDAGRPLSTYKNVVSRGDASATPALLVLLAGRAVFVFPVTRDRVTIGRGPGNDLVLDHATVSKTHALVTRSNGQLLVEDQGSRNGVIVGGAHVGRTLMSPGDAIQVGPYTLVYPARDIVPVIAP